MDVQIKLLIPLFLGDMSFEAGEVVEIEQDWAQRIVALGQAEFVVPDPHQAGAKSTATTHAPAAGHDPHQQHAQSATSMPPTERAVTRTGTPDPKTHPKK